jgi:HD-GYP domain-containing protein (c-di-GMP phosphodiesterase class II)
VTAVADALEEHGEKFAITAACGTALIPHEATTLDYALQLADERMYARKHGRRSAPREQAHDVLINIIRGNNPTAGDYTDGVAPLAVAVGRRLEMSGEQLDELERAAALHDVGKVGVPDAILTKPGPLDPQEWAFIRQHPILGERILSAAPALRPVAKIVRATHERWDGAGYPDGLKAAQIPLAARIVAVCDAYHAMTSERRYQPARTPELAGADLRREAGSQFDPAVIDAFLQELQQPTTPRASRSGTLDGDRLGLAAEVVSRVQELLDSVVAVRGEFRG